MFYPEPPRSGGIGGIGGKMPGGLGLCPQQDPGHSPLSEVLGAKPPETESFLGS